MIFYYIKSNTGCVDKEGNTVPEGVTVGDACSPCTCRGGQMICLAYRCAFSLPPHPDCTHVKIEGKCCPEWECPPSEYDNSSIGLYATSVYCSLVFVLLVRFEALFFSFICFDFSFCFVFLFLFLFSLFFFFSLFLSLFLCFFMFCFFFCHFLYWNAMPYSIMYPLWNILHISSRASIWIRMCRVWKGDFSKTSDWDVFARWNYYYFSFPKLF